jgi:hypothetical protein
MIVSQNFVWAHLPKTGGDATAAMMQKVPRLIVLADPALDNAKHLPLDERRGSIAGKLLVANMRRLSSWAVSMARHRERFGAYPDYEPQGAGARAGVASESAADDLLELIVGRYEIDVWLRQEQLEDDVVRFLREVAGLTDAEEAAVRSVGRVNENRSRLQLRKPAPERYFTPEQLEAIYANNPRWAAIERRVYEGATASADSRAG